MVGHRPHEQEVTGGAGGQVVLEGAEVEHLVVTTDEGGPQQAGARDTLQRRVGPQAGVAAPEGHGEAPEGGVGPDGAALMGQLPSVGAQRLDADKGQGGVVGHLDLGERHDQVSQPATARFGAHPRFGCGGQLGQQTGVHVDDDLDHSGPGRRSPRGPGSAGNTASPSVSADHVDDHERIIDDGTGCDVDDQRVDGEGLVEEEEVAGVGHHRSEQGLTFRMLAGPAQGQDVIGHRARPRWPGRR